MSTSSHAVYPDSPLREWASTQRAAVVGASGHIGQVLVPELLRLGVPAVVAVSRRPATGQPQPGVHWRQADLSSPAQLEAALEGATVLWHLAAWTDVARCEGDVRGCHDVNVLGTEHVVDAARRAGVRMLVYASTAHVYGNPEVQPVNEDAPVAPASAYARSKLAGEGAVLGTAADIGRVARIANVYGTGIDTRTVIGRALDHVRQGRPICLRNHHDIRDFIHVADVARGLVRIAALERAAPRTLNLTSGIATRIGDMLGVLAEVARESFGLNLDIAPPEEHDSPCSTLVLDGTRLSTLTGWSPETSLRDGLRDTLGEILTNQAHPAR